MPYKLNAFTGQFDLTSEGSVVVPPTLTPNSGGAVSEVAGTINVLGQTSNTSPVMYTTNGGAGLFYVENRAYTTRYVVDGSSTEGLRGTYTTIQAAINAAFADGAINDDIKTIYIREGYYPEDIVIPATAAINLVGANDYSSIIGGTMTYAGTGSRTIFNNIDFLALSSSSVIIPDNTIAYFYNCYFNAVSSGAIETTGTNDEVRLWDCIIKAATVTIGGTFFYHGAKFYNCDLLDTVVTIKDTSSAQFYSCVMNQIVLADQGIAECYDCTFNYSFSPNVIAAGNISGTSANPEQQRIYNCTFITRDHPAITATAPFFLSGNIVEYETYNYGLFDSNPTITFQQEQQGNLRAIHTDNADYSATYGDSFIGIDSSGGVVTVTLPATGYKGQEYTIADVAGAAATHNITVAGNGHNIDGAANATISTNYGKVTVVFTGSIWKII